MFYDDNGRLVSSSKEDVQVKVMGEIQ